MLKSSGELDMGEEKVPAGTRLFFDADLKADTAAARIAALSGEGLAEEDELRLRDGRIKARFL